VTTETETLRGLLDTIVKAALAARDLLPEPEPPAPHWREGAPYEEPPGIVTAEIHEPECGPGTCTCGATVSADGTVTPAATP
jgi:hypothetical protein